MLTPYGFTEEDNLDLVQFIEDNKTSLRELSLRTILKAADLKASMPDKWKRVARMTIMKK